jgi:hypothetical protein
MSLSTQPLAAADHMRVALRIHTALWEMRVGRGRREEWADCADALNMTEALVHAGKLDGKTYTPMINKAIDGLVEAIDCPPAPMRMNRAAEAALITLVCTYDECLGRLARDTIKSAGSRVILKIAESRNAGSDVRVVGA